MIKTQKNGLSETKHDKQSAGRKDSDAKTHEEYDLLLVGNPNVGKSVIFHKLTGSYANVSNYPGTTVDIMTGYMKVGSHHNIRVIDTPGFYNLSTITEEERVSKNIILNEKNDIILHVTDAKNIVRMLPLTLQLLEAGLSVILVLNMYDELTRAGLKIDSSHLEHDLGIPCVITTAANGLGIDNLKSRIMSIAEKRYQYRHLEDKNHIYLRYTERIETVIKSISDNLQNEYYITKRAIALMLMQNDIDALELVKDEQKLNKIQNILMHEDQSALRVEINSIRFKHAEGILSDSFSSAPETKADKARSFIDRFTMNKYTSMLAVAVILYFGFYHFVGGFGAGYLVDLIEGGLFETIINPQVNKFFHYLFGDSIFFNLFAGDYGIITLGIRYSIAIVLPIVFTFFLMFSLLEDSGYLPRLSMTLNNLLKGIGLSGRSVIPLILGLGCGTMATVVTRTLETKRERLFVIFLLALAVPCAAQMGVIIGVLGKDKSALMIWFATILIIFSVAGFVLDKIIKGSRPTFFMELPPLRTPRISNILFKTFTRMKWYAIEVIPIFVYASIIIWIGKVTGVFDYLSMILSYPSRMAGLPDKMGDIFLYGFFRRDFGAAGLFDIQQALSMRQLTVAAVILTLFIPCVAQFSVMIKERGIKTALYILVTVIPFAFFAGIVLNQILLFGGMK